MVARLLSEHLLQVSPCFFGQASLEVEDSSQLIQLEESLILRMTPY